MSYETSIIDLLPEQESNQQMETVEEDKRITTPNLTKYEKSRVLGTRALQISMGAPILVEYTTPSGEFFDPLKVAELELQQSVIPMVIRRYLPNGEYEDWKVSELTN
ncbi:hypothetical protein PCE1_003317 [Barthelona sp. PCE]